MADAADRAVTATVPKGQVAGADPAVMVATRVLVVLSVATPIRIAAVLAP
jgi:hypothetical protein